MVKINCIETLKIPIMVLTNLGILNIKPTKSTIIKLSLNFLIDLTVVTLCIINVKKLIDTNNISHAYWMGSLLFPMVIYISKIVSFQINKAELTSILRCLKSYTFNSHSERQNKHIQLINDMSVLILKYFAAILVLPIGLFAVLPLIRNQDVLIPPPIQVGRFDILYKILHLFALISMCFRSTCLDAFCLTSMTLGVAQLSILQENLRNTCKSKSNNVKPSRKGKRRYLSLMTKHSLKKSAILYETIIR